MLEEMGCFIDVTLTVYGRKEQLLVEDKISHLGPDTKSTEVNRKTCIHFIGLWIRSIALCAVKHEKR